MSATCPTGTVVTTSRVAASRNSGSTVSRYSSVSAICAGSLPYGLEVRVLSRSTSTSAGALSNTMWSKADRTQPDCASRPIRSTGRLRPAERRCGPPTTAAHVDGFVVVAVVGVDGAIVTPRQLVQQRRLADTRHPGDQYPRHIVIVAGRDSIPASRAAEWSPYLRRRRRPEPAFWVAVSGTDSRRGGRRLAATRTTGPAWLRSTASGRSALRGCRPTGRWRWWTPSGPARSAC